MPNRPSSRPSSFSHQIWIGLFTMSVVLLLLLGWSFLHLEQGTPSYVIGQVSLIVLSITLIGTLLAMFSGWQPF
ncbi:hypothetical protein [Natrialba swarupiae]|uniref:Uncharacterized protein n=1 Tax=Natrialba swarupiae TaxID=2448032 RepID=A0A5D5AQS2_9EURY|nr:hypothetical protein [Natrialba swarupiae]TYT63363.1 hypothetical protein FYC77_04640 [Natrialba swarupiae]